MDRSQFDALARLISARQSRRGALAAILGAMVLGHAPGASLAKRRGRVRAQAKTCYPGGTQCVPGRGKNNSGCDFFQSTAFFEQDVRGSNLSNINLRGAAAWKADFRGANLSGACLVDANLLGAKLGASVNLDKAILCRTVLPDGRIDNSSCNKGTDCCPTAPTGTCQGLFALCGLFAGECCEGLTCNITFNPLVSACQKHCTSDADCEPLHHNLTCQDDVLICPAVIQTKCCSPRR
jgi:hypothetical protein